MRWSEKTLREPRRDDEGDGERDEHAHARVDGDGAHVRTHQSRDEGHRQQRGDHGEGREDGGTANLVDRRGNETRERRAGIAPAVPTITASRRPSAKNTSATTSAVANSSFSMSCSAFSFAV